ncbi:MAG TPA: hemolysin III family protein [Prolixibacteraceae bacterium]|nr:hemolysin III family protein [Prolixibacteraceae bacterium]HPS12524.1 hemolysin III family protein [Prolixibacteraceae bacterium]
MKDAASIKVYSPREENINIWSHALGIVLSFIALSLLLFRSCSIGEAKYIVSFTIFGLSLLVLYTASTLYHSARNPERRLRLKVFDHASIFVLIAGSYTPFTLVTLSGTTGWVIFGISWGTALVGIILKIFFTGKYSILSTIMYVLMGWVIVFAIKPLYHNLPVEGFWWLVGGGIAYTVGAVLYSIKKIKFNHAIFHVLVLVGSLCHFIAVFCFL